MTEAEIFEFDLNGVIIYRNMLTRDQVDYMNGVLDEHLTDESYNFRFLELDPVFMEVMALPSNAEYPQDDDRRTGCAWTTRTDFRWIRSPWIGAMSGQTSTADRWRTTASTITSGSTERCTTG